MSGARRRPGGARARSLARALVAALALALGVAQVPAGPKTARAAGPSGAQAPLRVGVFNVQWALDPTEGRSDLADAQNAADERNWRWKVDGLAAVLARRALDVVALAEVGGRGELADLVAAIAADGGPAYQVAWVAGTDTATAQQVAILSRFPVSHARRFDVPVSKHVATEVDLPGLGRLTVVAAHLKSGGDPADVKQRRKQARRLKRAIDELDGPVLVLGDLNTSALPGRKGYPASAAGILAGAATETRRDDCYDSGRFPSARGSHIGGASYDRIFTCRLWMQAARVEAAAEVWPDGKDPFDRTRPPWSAKPFGPGRDLSDHLLVTADVLPGR